MKGRALTDMQGCWRELNSHHWMMGRLCHRMDLVVKNRHYWMVHKMRGWSLHHRLPVPYLHSQLVFAKTLLSDLFSLFPDARSIPHRCKNNNYDCLGLQSMRSNVN